MKIVLTGASGAIGPAVIAELEKAHQLTFFSRKRIDSAHPQIIGDLTALQNCQDAVSGTEAIVHLAAYSEPAPDAFQFNMLSTYALLEAARLAGVPRFIFASTNCVYGHCYRQSDRPFRPSHLPIDEAHPCLPENNYGLSKLLCEQMLATYSETWGMASAAFRLNWVWRQEEINWRREMDVYDEARFARSFWAYVDARDCASAFRLAVESPNLPGSGVYNISAADQTAKAETNQLIEKYYADIPSIRPVEGHESIFNWRKARDTFGYVPRHSWREG